MSPKQQRFVQEYLVDLNATQAAIRAGYSPRTAASIGQENLIKPEIQEAIRQAQQARSARTAITADNVLRELALIAYQRAGKLYRPDGTLKPPSEWDDTDSAIIAGVETTEEFHGRGEDRELVGYTKKVKRWDKLRALELLGKHLGMFVEKHELSIVDDDSLNRAIETELAHLATARQGEAAGAHPDGLDPSRSGPDSVAGSNAPRPVAGPGAAGIVDRPATTPLFEAGR